MSQKFCTQQSMLHWHYKSIFKLNITSLACCGRRLFEFIWLFRCNIIIIFCKIGASQLDTPITTLDVSQLHTHAQTIEYIFFPILLGIGSSIREFHYHCTYNCDPGIIK